MSPHHLSWGPHCPGWFSLSSPTILVTLLAAIMSGRPGLGVFYNLGVGVSSLTLETWKDNTRLQRCSRLGCSNCSVIALPEVPFPREVLCVRGTVQMSPPQEAFPDNMHALPWAPRWSDWGFPLFP